MRQWCWPLVLAGTGYFNDGHRIQGGVLMSVFKFTDAVRVGWKAAKRPSCRYTSCQLPATARSWLRRLACGQLDGMVNRRSTKQLPDKRTGC